jgi:hypothetical protein
MLLFKNQHELTTAIKFYTLIILNVNMPLVNDNRISLNEYGISFRERGDMS